MRTVKEISERTGISVRTLHYYDEIGLLKPTSYSEGGYRLYDDKALERLQQILFFREFDMPLLEIKEIMDNPELDRDSVLLTQKKMLEIDRQSNIPELLHFCNSTVCGYNHLRDSRGILFQ